MGNNWLNLLNLLKRILILTEIAQNKNKKILNALLEKRSSEIINLGKIINPDNLIYNYKTERKSPKNFRNDQNPTD